jgi:hypothetical protein
LGLDYTVTNRLEGVALAADLRYLKFYYMHVGQYGPLQYDLQRVSP